VRDYHPPQKKVDKAFRRPEAISKSLIPSYENSPEKTLLSIMANYYFVLSIKNENNNNNNETI